MPLKSHEVVPLKRISRSALVMVLTLRRLRPGRGSHQVIQHVRPTSAATHRPRCGADRHGYAAAGQRRPQCPVTRYPAAPAGLGQLIDAQYPQELEGGVGDSVKPPLPLVDSLRVHVQQPCHIFDGQEWVPACLGKGPRVDLPDPPAALHGLPPRLGRTGPAGMTGARHYAIEIFYLIVCRMIHFFCPESCRMACHLLHIDKDKPQTSERSRRRRCAPPAVPRSQNRFAYNRCLALFGFPEGLQPPADQVPLSHRSQVRIMCIMLIMSCSDAIRTERSGLLPHFSESQRLRPK